MLSHTESGAADTDGVAVQLTNVSVSIDRRPVVRGVDLLICEGEFVALMGANGSGKSTLVRAMTGLRPLAQGSVRLFDTEIGHFHDWQRIGFVPQRSGAGSGVPASVWEVVSSGRLTHRRPFLPMSRKDRDVVTSAIEIVGLSEEKRTAVSNLSGGQQQRVLIARSLAGQPDLLFLDEPTAGVDLPNQQVLADTLAMLSARGVTIILVAHELGPLAPLIDRSVVLRDGRVVHDGEPLGEAQVHHPDLGLGHAHHPQSPAPDHVPHVAGPFETSNPDEEVR